MCAMAAIVSLCRKCAVMILHLSSAFLAPLVQHFALKIFFSSSLLQLWHLEGSRICGWRCPFGQLCGKNNRELNMKKDGGDALTAGAWHLLDKKQHWDPLNTWEEAVVAANDGLTEGKREIDIVLDDNGNQVEPPTKIWWDSGNKAGGGGKGKGGGGKSWDSWGGDCRNNRSRSHRSWSMPIGSGSSSSTNLTLANGGGVPLSSDVYISRIELDHCIDCISRPDLWRDIPFNQATNSWMCKSRQQLPASYSFDDWARRAREHMIPWCTHRTKLTHIR